MECIRVCSGMFGHVGLSCRLLAHASGCLGELGMFWRMFGYVGVCLVCMGYSHTLYNCTLVLLYNL